MNLLDHLRSWGHSRKADRVKAVAAFCGDREWAEADFRRDKHGAARLPDGLVEQIDRSLRL